MEQKHQFPTEEVTLPSKGLLYPEGSPLRKGVIEMKYMTAKEEDILTNQNYIANGTVIDKLIKSLIVSKVDYNDLLIGDKNALLIAARILGYGKDYTFDYAGEKVTLDLSLLNAKEVDESNFADGKNEFSFTLPASGANITFKLLTHSDETKITKEIEGLKRINKDASPELSTRLKYIITGVDGNVDTAFIRKFVDNQFLARDSRAFRKHLAEIQPDIDLKFYPENGPEEGVDIPLGVTFLWPDFGV